MAKLTARENGQVKYSDGEMRKMDFDELRSLLVSPSAGKPAARGGADKAPAEEVMTPAGVLSVLVSGRRRVGLFDPCCLYTLLVHGTRAEVAEHQS
jgi:hypothetical protein